MTEVVARWDPAVASGSELADYHALTVAAFAIDRPDAPLPSYEATTARLRTPLTHVVGQDLWAARRGGRILGVAILQTREGDNDHLCVADLRVHPEVRRQGMGTALLRRVLPELRAADLRRVAGEGVTVGGAGQAWARALGFSEVNGYVLQVLDIGRHDPGRWELPAPAGYHSRRWTLTAPDDLLDSYAWAHNAMSDAPAGDSSIRFSRWTAAVVRDAEALARERGVERRVAVAVHAATGEVAGFTETEIYPAQPEQVFQQDTAVLPAYRGHGLGRWLKAAMMGWLLEDRPGLERVVTSTAAGNAHMIRINEELGYSTVRAMTDVEAEVDALAIRLRR